MTATMELRCSFCQQNCESNELIVGDLGARICLGCLRRHHNAPAVRNETTNWPGCAELDVTDMLRSLPLISAEATQLDLFMRHRVFLIRERNIPYRQIGEALGVSRQAAWERFSQSASD